jgi:hypothetical protein
LVVFFGLEKTKYLLQRMGTYLSTPVTDKCQESGDSLDCPYIPCKWGVVDMQGWRKSMEDAHVAITDIPLPLEASESHTADAKVFGVFDGHGGPEVARFVGMYLVSVLTQQPTWKSGIPLTTSLEAGDSKVGLALRSTFHALDRMIDDPGRRYAYFVLIKKGLVWMHHSHSPSL